MKVTVIPPKRSERVRVLWSDPVSLGRIGRLLSPAPTVKDLLRAGLTYEDITDLEFREPLASEIAEYMGRYGVGIDGLVKAANAVIGWHVQDINREIEMLVLRRRILMRKIRAMGRLLDALTESPEPRQAI